MMFRRCVVGVAALVVLCLSSSSSSSLSSVSAANCQPGAYLDSVEDKCYACPAGKTTYQDQSVGLSCCWNQPSCFFTTPGNYSDGSTETGYGGWTVATRPKPCEPGHYCGTGVTGMSLGNECGFGTYCSGGNAVPTPCPVNYYCPNYARTAPTPCPQTLGTWHTDGMTNAVACKQTNPRVNGRLVAKDYYASSLPRLCIQAGFTALNDFDYDSTAYSTLMEYYDSGTSAWTTCTAGVTCGLDYITYVKCYD